MSDNLNVPTDSFADLLRSKRLEQKLSLQEVSEKLKLATARIEQLEQLRSLEGLNSFDRGHIRNYAELLNVDLSAFNLPVQQAQNLSSELKSVDQSGYDFSTPQTSKRLTKLIVIIILAGVGYLIVMGLLEMSETSSLTLPGIHTESLSLSPSELDEPPLLIQPSQD